MSKIKNKAGRKWFDGKDEAVVLAKCKEVWAFGGNDAEAAFYAEVSKDSISRYLKAHDDVRELRDRLKEQPVLRARKTVVENLSDPHIAFRYLERKRKDEFAERQEVSGELRIGLWQQFVRQANEDAPKYLTKRGRGRAKTA
ncbi:MAG: hypothetical protein HYR90_00900 [Candidatus Andersenbacteria bacterium]|nr:hypothetical protein [Candidatus Andersenbacteria bacterium]MBI3251193.1 hypothetical protein [Candidatus Andersenbacteria bacterium]